MAQTQMEQLIDRWLQDSSFREAMRQDPNGTIRGAGFRLSAADFATIQAVDWTLSDSDLEARARDALALVGVL